MKLFIKKIREQKCVISRILKFNDYKNCLFKNEFILKSQQNLKVKQIVYIEQINNIALSCNDDKRLQTLIELQHIHM